MKKIGAVVLMFMAVACTDPKQKEVDALRAEAIALHDEVMPRMGEIVELQKELKNQRDGLLQTNDSLSQLRTNFTVTIAQLEVAHEGMMAWMAQYDPTYDESNPLDSSVVYYTEQRDAIKMVKDAMESSIEEAKELKNEGK